MLTRLAGAAGTAALVALLTSCSGDGAPATAPAAAPPGSSPAAAAPADPAAAAKDAVRTTFTGYASALLARDFTGACAALTDQAARSLVADLTRQNIPATSCDQAYAVLYEAPEAAQRFDESNRTVTVTDVAVDGTTATLTYTGRVGGKPVPPQTIRALQVDGRWRIAPAG